MVNGFKSSMHMYTLMYYEYLHMQDGGEIDPAKRRKHLQYDGSMLMVYW